MIIHTTDAPRGETLHALWLHIGPGDAYEPVATIMLQGED